MSSRPSPNPDRLASLGCPGARYKLAAFGAAGAVAGLAEP